MNLHKFGWIPLPPSHESIYRAGAIIAIFSMSIWQNDNIGDNNHANTYIRKYLNYRDHGNTNRRIYFESGRGKFCETAICGVLTIFF